MHHCPNNNLNSGTTQKEDAKKTPAKMLASILSKHCMCTCSYMYFVFVKDSSFNCQLLYGSRNKPQLHANYMCSVNFCWRNHYEYYTQTKWHIYIAASISVGLPENCRLVWVLSLRTISGEYNTKWFMLFFRIWIVVIATAVIVLSWWRKRERRTLKYQTGKLPVLVTCRSDTLVMLSSKPWKHSIWVMEAVD